MGRKAEARDIYLNWFGMEVTSAANSATLQETAMNSMGGIATRIAWRIHVIEMFPVIGSTTNLGLTLAVSTRKNLAEMPAINDKGLVCFHKTTLYVVTSGGGIIHQPAVYNYLPPMIVASPNLSFYCQTDINDSPQQSKVHSCRIGFTAVELTSDVYQELYGTWNFAD